MLADFHLAYITIPLLILAAAIRWRDRRRRRALPQPASRTAVGPVGFGYKASWLALRSESPVDVADALGLAGVHRATWSGGIGEAHRSAAGTVFVTPAVDGWVLALGPFGNGWGRTEDLAALSRRFGEAQLFSTHRVSGYDEWQRWQEGAPVRRYAFADGEVLLDEGEREGADEHVVTAAELDASEDDDFEDIRLPDEEMTIAKAREWSVDPTTLDVRHDLPPTGLLGFRPR